MCCVPHRPVLRKGWGWGSPQRRGDAENDERKEGRNRRHKDTEREREGARSVGGGCPPGTALAPARAPRGTRLATPLLGWGRGASLRVWEGAGRLIPPCPLLGWGEGGMSRCGTAGCCRNARAVRVLRHRPLKRFFLSYSVSLCLLFRFSAPLTGCGPRCRRRCTPARGSRLRSGGWQGRSGRGTGRR